MTNKPIIVYYSPMVGTGRHYHSVTLFNDTLEPVLADIKKNKTDLDSQQSFFSCRGFLGFNKNLYMITNPFDIDVTVNDMGQIINNGNKELDDIFSNRPKQIENCKNLNYEYYYFFYSEESLEIEVMSPFMHDSSFTKNAFIVPGSFNISKWFRPLNPEIQFLPNHDNHVVSQKGDPLMYIRFKTDRPIILKQFFMPRELMDISESIVSYKKYEKNKTFSYLYSLFSNSGLPGKILRLIKDNLVDPK